MKFPSLFGRTPSHRRFEYRPRFYDPQKEQREERDRRIREELALEKREASTDDDYRSRIKGSFQRSRRRAKPSSETSAIMLRLVVLLFMTVLLIGYLTWGAKVFYVFFLAFPVWIYFRFARRG